MRTLIKNPLHPELKLKTVKFANLFNLFSELLTGTEMPREPVTNVDHSCNPSESKEDMMYDSDDQVSFFYIFK